MPRRPELESSAAKVMTFVIVLAAHAVVLGGLFLGIGGCASTDKPKEDRFKVKLGAATPSHAPVVGRPERPPTAQPSPAPSVQPPPEPRLTPPPKPAPPQPRLTPPPRPVRKPKPRTRTSKPRPTTPQPVFPRPSGRPTPPRAPRPPRPPRRPRPEVYSGDPVNLDTRTWGVPVGTRHVGQRQGPVDHRPPMGGADRDEADRKWGELVQRFVENLWDQPETLFLKGDESAILELTVGADGRISHVRLISKSGNPRMDESIRRLIDKLKGRIAPRPPRGGNTVEVTLKALK